MKTISRNKEKCFLWHCLFKNNVVSIILNQLRLFLTFFQREDSCLEKRKIEKKVYFQTKYFGLKSKLFESLFDNHLLGFFETSNSSPLRVWKKKKAVARSQSKNSPVLSYFNNIFIAELLTLSQCKVNQFHVSGRSSFRVPPPIQTFRCPEAKENLFLPFYRMTMKHKRPCFKNPSVEWLSYFTSSISIC